MKKLFSNKFVSALLAPFLVLLFFLPNLLQGKIPMPSDALLGLYHPWRDNSYDGYNPEKFPVKNPLVIDAILQTYPWKKLVINNFQNLRLPLWNPYSFAGQPLLANIQSSPFQFTNLILLIFPFEISWGLQIIIVTALTSFFMYLFLNSLKLSKLASIFGSLILPFSGFFLSWMTWGAVVATAMLLPLMLFLINKISEKQTPILFLMIVFSSSQVIFSGHWQTAIYVFLAIIIYLIFKFISNRDLGKILIILLAIILGILLSFPQILPSLEFLNHSNRQIDQGYYQGRKDWFLPYQHLVQLIAPDFFGNPTTYNYWGVFNYGEFVSFIGIVPLFFALFALISKKRQTSFFLILAVLSLLLALENPISKAPYVLSFPFISSMQPSRIVFLMTFALVSLAAIGFNEFTKEKFNKKQLAPAIIILAFLSLLLISLKVKNLYPQLENLSAQNIVFRNLIFPLVVSIALFIILVVINFKNSKKVVIIALFLLTVFEISRFAYKFTPFSKTALIFPSTQTSGFLLKQEKPFRIMTTDRRIMHPNTQVVYNIESVQGYDPLYLKDYAQLVSTWQSEKVAEAVAFNRIVTPQRFDSRITDLLNVKYVLSFDEISNPKLKKVFEEGKTKVYENKEVTPRFFFVERIEKVKDESIELRKLLDENFDLTKTAVSSTFGFEGSKHESSITVKNYTDQSVDLAVSTKEQAPLVTSNVFYPGWNAYIDGNRNAIQKVNYMFQSVLVPAGEHEVEFKYQPQSFYNGICVSVLSLVLTGIFILYLWRKRYQ